ncbi:MAG: hypothetical protein GY798_34115 [Hyphomicrobiales bacterium]|nr:hypothetical protein [Hyphomicrobiales bacterium]
MQGGAASRRVAGCLGVGADIGLPEASTTSTPSINGGAGEGAGDFRDGRADNRVAAPPSGHLCGLYAATDATRGVHKAPANVQLRGALDLTRAITEADQAQLNPVGVNCIRQFADGMTVSRSGGREPWPARRANGAMCRPAG